MAQWDTGKDSFQEEGGFGRLYGGYDTEFGSFQCYIHMRGIYVSGTVCGSKRTDETSYEKYIAEQKV
jgi:hypothetical protein